jgi:hypothetical protein
VARRTTALEWFRSQAAVRVFAIATSHFQGLSKSEKKGMNETVLYRVVT